MLPPKIENYLNKGYTVAAEVEPEQGNRCFVRIRAIAKPDIPREASRYVNSKYSIWDYWSFEFRRIVLRSGWEQDGWNYDRYLINDEKRATANEFEFLETLNRWIPDATKLQHIQDSSCPE